MFSPTFLSLIPIQRSLSLPLMTNQERVQIREKNSVELELPPLTFS